MDIKEKIIKKTQVYKGKFIKVENVQVKLPNGVLATRDIIRHPGACAILALDEDNNIIIEKQYRTPLERVLLEIPAGKIDIGEKPLTCAKRELKEETGYTSNSFTLLNKIALTPGYSDEIIYLYLAKNIVYESVNLDDDEFLTIEKIPLEKAYNLVITGKIENSITMIGILIVYDLYKEHKT